MIDMKISISLNDVELIKQLKHNEVEVDWVVYRKVYVSNISSEDALQHKKEKILLATMNWWKILKYLTVHPEDEESFKKWFDYKTAWYSHIAEIPEPKEKTKVTLELTPEQIEQIKKIIS
jgi:hypothetical protein